MTRALAGTAAAGVLAATVAAGSALGAGAALPLYREGPPPAHTGGFDEPTCAECHFGAPLNGDAGSLTLDAPAGFVPGESYRLEVRLERAEMAAAGFQLAARFADGEAAGTQAGILAPVDGRTAVTGDSATGVAYGHQTLAGSSPMDAGATGWVMEWTAPDSGAAVVIHAAANAANDDASEFGDFVYTARREIQPAGSPRVDGEAAGPAPWNVRHRDGSPRSGMEP